MNKLFDIYWKLIAKPFIRKDYISKLQRKYNYENKVSLITSNCIGGEIYNDLQLKFLSPTINLWISEPDFLKFVFDLKGYTSNKLTFVKNDRGGYPVANLKDIKIHFLHYHSEQEASEKWYERCSRINYDNIYIIMSDFELSQEEFLNFQNIKNVKNKIMFTTDPNRAQYKNVFYIKEYKPYSYVRKYAVNRLNGYRDFEKFWDFVDWLNKD